MLYWLQSHDRVLSAGWWVVRWCWWDDLCRHMFHEPLHAACSFYQEIAEACLKVASMCQQQHWGNHLCELLVLRLKAGRVDMEGGLEVLGNAAKV